MNKDSRNLRVEERQGKRYGNLNFKCISTISQLCRVWYLVLLFTFVFYASSIHILRYMSTTSQYLKYQINNLAGGLNFLLIYKETEVQVGQVVSQLANSNKQPFSLCWTELCFHQKVLSSCVCGICGRMRERSSYFYCIRFLEVHHVFQRSGELYIPWAHPGLGPQSKWVEV